MSSALSSSPVHPPAPVESPVLFDHVAADLNIRSMTFLLRVIQSVGSFEDGVELDVNKAGANSENSKRDTSIASPKSKHTKKWLLFLDQVATLLVRKQHEVIATAASVRQKIPGTQTRRIVYTANPTFPRTSASFPATSPSMAPTFGPVPNPKLTLRWLQMPAPIDMWAESYLSKQDVPREVHAFVTRRFLVALQETKQPDRQFELTEQLRQYIVVVCHDKIKARWNYKFPQHPDKLQFKSIPSVVDTNSLSKFPHVNETGRPMWNWAVPPELETSSAKEIGIADSARSLYQIELPLDTNQHILYTASTILDFNKFLVRIFSAGDKAIERISEAKKTRNTDTLKRGAASVVAFLYELRALSKSKAFWVHLRHTAFDDIMVGQHSTHQESQEQLSLAAQEEEAEEAQDLQHEKNVERGSDLLFRWVRICAAHIFAVDGVAEVANPKFSPNPSPKSSPKRPEKAPAVSSTPAQSLPPPPMSLRIDSITLPPPSNLKAQEPLIDTLSAVLRRYKFNFPVVGDEALEIDAPRPPGEMTAQRLLWYLGQWASGNHKGLRDSDATHLQLLANPQAWATSFVGNYHCESGMGAMLFAMDRLGDQAISKVLTGMQSIIGVSKPSCPWCIVFMSLLHADTTHGTQHINTEDPEVHPKVTSSCHGQHWGWVIPPAQWGVPESVVTAMSSHVEMTLYKVLFRVVQDVQKPAGKKNDLGSLDSGSPNSAEHGVTYDGGEHQRTRRETLRDDD